MLEIFEFDSLSRSKNIFKYKGNNGLWGICTINHEKITMPIYEDIVDIVKWGDFIRVKTSCDHQAKIINFKGELLPLPYIKIVGTHIPNYFIIGEETFKNIGLYNINSREIIPPIASLIVLRESYHNVNLFDIYDKKHYFIHNTNYDEIINIVRNNDIVIYYQDNERIIEASSDESSGRNITYCDIQVDEEICCIVYDIKYKLLKTQGICLLPVFSEIELLYADPFNHIFKISNDNLWGVFSNKKEICPINYDEILFCKDSQRPKVMDYKLRKGKLYGIISRSGSIIEPQYEDIKNISTKYIAIKLNDKWGIINSDNQIIIIPQYEDILEFNLIYNNIDIETESNISFIVKTFNKEIKYINKDNIPLENFGEYVRDGRSFYIISFYNNYSNSVYCEIIDKQLYTTDLSNAYKDLESDIFKYDSSNVDLSGYNEEFKNINNNKENNTNALNSEIENITLTQTDSTIQTNYVKKEHLSEQMQAIDLGLSVKWADRNFGANSPTEVGECCAWAELTSKKKYTWENYKHWVSSGKFGPFLEKHFSREFHSIESCDDAVTHKYGKPWRIPTAAEFEELINKCKWIKTKENGEPGYRIYGNNGNSIFLPTNVEQYWSATRLKNSPQHAKVLNFNYTKAELSYRSRFYGFNLRGVCD